MEKDAKQEKLEEKMEGEKKDSAVEERTEEAAENKVGKTKNTGHNGAPDMKVLKGNDGMERIHDTATIERTKSGTRRSSKY